MKNRQRLWLAVLVLGAVVLTGCLGGGDQSTTEYTLEMSVEGEGTTEPSVGTHSYSPDSLATVVATPATDWDFYAWIGEHQDELADRFEAETDILMDGDKELTAFFDQESERVAVNLNTSTLQGSQGTVKDLTGNPPYPPGFKVEVEAEPEDEDDAFLHWQVALLGSSTLSVQSSSLDPRTYFENYEQARTHFTVPNENVSITAVFTKRTPPIEPGTFDYTVEDLAQGISGTYGVTDHAWDLSGLDNGSTLDFYFTARNIPDRFSVFYGTWDELENDPDSILVFNSGWVSQNPANYESETTYPEGVEQHYWHEDVEDVVHFGSWSGGVYEGLITKEAGKDVLFIRVESRDQGTIWDYSFEETPSM